MSQGTYGQVSRFAITVGKNLNEEGGWSRQVDVWADGRWLTCDDNQVYVPHFAGRLQDAVGCLLTDPTHHRGRPYPKLSIADNYRRLKDDAETDNSAYSAYSFMDWGPTADNVSM